MTATAEKHQHKILKLREAWRNRKMIRLTIRHAQRLKQGKKVYVVVDGIGYEIQTSRLPQLFDAAGKRLSNTMVKRLLRGVR